MVFDENLRRFFVCDITDIARLQGSQWQLFRGCDIHYVIDMVGVSSIISVTSEQHSATYLRVHAGNFKTIVPKKACYQTRFFEFSSRTLISRINLTKKESKNLVTLSIWIGMSDCQKQTNKIYGKENINSRVYLLCDSPVPVPIQQLALFNKEKKLFTFQISW
jgi:hypothetical protein